jgi:hypothetical protein
MLLNLEKLTCSPFIVNLQKTKELEVKGYTNLEVIKEKGKKEFLSRIIFEYDDETIVTPLLQPEILSFFPLKSKLYQGKITFHSDEIKEIELNFSKLKYEKFKNLIDENAQAILADTFEFNPYIFYAFDNNVYIPVFTIAQYFYFPNTHIRRLFFKNDIYSLVHNIDCKTGNIIFKQNVKFNDITAIIAYLFKCNEKFSKLYSNMYKYNILTPLQRAEQNNEPLRFLPTLFKFPDLKGNYKLLVRGEKIDNYFIVYEILNFDFTQIVDLEELKVSYKGKKQVRTFKTHSVSSKIPKNKKNLSQIEEYNKDYLETNLSLLEIDSEIIKNNLKVKKIKPLSFKEYFSSFDVLHENIKNDGITLSSYGNKESAYGKSNLSIEKADLEKIIKELKKQLPIKIIKKEVKTDYSYIYFSLTFKSGYVREHLLIKLNRPDTAWYILSSDNLPLAYKPLSYHLLQIKDGRSEKYKNNNEFTRDILKKYGVCFHKSLKNSAESFESWMNRLINRLFDWKNCKGI